MSGLKCDPAVMQVLGMSNFQRVVYHVLGDPMVRPKLRGVCCPVQVNVSSVRLGGLHPRHGSNGVPNAALDPAGGSLAVWFDDRRGVLDKVNVTTVYGRYKDMVADRDVCFEAAVPLCHGQ